MLNSVFPIRSPRYGSSDFCTLSWRQVLVSFVHFRRGVPSPEPFANNEWDAGCAVVQSWCFPWFPSLPSYEARSAPNSKISEQFQLPTTGGGGGRTREEVISSAPLPQKGEGAGDQPQIMANETGVPLPWITFYFSVEIHFCHSLPVRVRRERHNSLVWT